MSYGQSAHESPCHITLHINTYMYIYIYTHTFFKGMAF